MELKHTVSPMVGVVIPIGFPLHVIVHVVHEVVIVGAAHQRAKTINDLMDGSAVDGGDAMTKFLGKTLRDTYQVESRVVVGIKLR